MMKEELQSLIDRVIGKKGIMHSSAWWVRKLLYKMLSYVDNKAEQESENVEREVIDNEETTAAALNDLKARIDGLPSTMVIDHLRSQNKTAALSANQGRVLGDLLGKKQEVLVSGENIKTFNGESILGEGNIEIEIPEYEPAPDEVYIGSEEPADAKLWVDTDEEDEGGGGQTSGNHMGVYFLPQAMIEDVKEEGWHDLSQEEADELVQALEHYESLTIVLRWKHIEDDYVIPASWTRLTVPSGGVFNFFMHFPDCWLMNDVLGFQELQIERYADGRVEAQVG